MLLGLLDNSIVEKVKNTKIISKRNSHILKGIIYATVSVIAGLYLVLVPTNGSKFLHAIYCFMQNAEISFMAFLIFYFLLFLKEMSVLVGAIHNDKGAKTDKEIKELKEKIQSKQNQWQFPSSSNSTTLGQFVPKLRKEKRRPLSYWAAQMLTI